MGCDAAMNIQKALRQIAHNLLKRHPSRRGPYAITDAQLKRSVSTVDVICTPVGEFPSPEPFNSKYRAAPKRKDGGIDRRFNIGREILAEEERLISHYMRKYALEQD
jgi:hypothetical protein